MTERQTRWLLIFLLLTQLVLLSLQAPDPSGRRSLLEGVGVRAVAPFPRLVSSLSRLLESASHNISLRTRLLEENLRLRAEVEELRREQVRTFGLERELGRLSEALGYTRPFAGRLRVADVVYIDHASWLQSLLLYIGGNGIQPNQPVVAPDGLVGRVILTSGPYAKVQLITDRAASVGAMVERTRRQGVVRGVGRGLLELAFVPLQADIRVGDRVVSAGIDGIYSRGIPIGVVTSVTPGSDLFYQVEVRPLVDFGFLDQVYVLEREAPSEQLKEEQVDAQP